MVSALPLINGCRPRAVAGAWSALRPERGVVPADSQLARSRQPEGREGSTPAALCPHLFDSLGLPSARPAPAPSLAAAPGRGGRGASGRGRVASAQDGGLGGAGLALEERTLARRAGVVREAGDAAPSGFGPGEKYAGGPRLRGPLPGFPGGPLLPGSSGMQHLKVLNGAFPVLRGAFPAFRRGQRLLTRARCWALKYVLWTPPPLDTTWVPGEGGHLFPISVTVQVIT